MLPVIEANNADDDIVRPSILPFVAVHIGCLAAIWTGVTWEALDIAGKMVKHVSQPRKKA